MLYYRRPPFDPDAARYPVPANHPRAPDVVTVTTPPIPCAPDVAQTPDNTSGITVAPRDGEQDNAALTALTARSLQGRAFGRRERDVLLRAAASDASAGCHITEALSTRAEREATLRAVRLLAKLGLVRSMRRSPSGHVEVWRSRFGDELARRYGDAWRRGERVRWDDRVAQAFEAAKAVA